jgi:hypothetical protein
MAQNTTITAVANEWTQLTNADVTAITFQVMPSGFYVYIKATTDTTAPTDLSGAIKYSPGQGERNVDLADLFPGIAGANRVWAYARENASVMVSHA